MSQSSTCRHGNGCRSYASSANAPTATMMWGLFSGLLFCADCGHVMYQQRYQTDKRKQDCYICGSYKKRTADCTAHFIRTDLLTAGVLDNLRKVTAYAQKHEARFVKLLIQQNEMGGKRKLAAAASSLNRCRAALQNFPATSSVCMRTM